MRVSPKYRRKRREENNTSKQILAISNKKDKLKAEYVRDVVYST